jgi:hypothetical protein
LRSVTQHVFALESLSFLFSCRPLRCDRGPNDPKARSRRRPTERAGRHLEPTHCLTTSATAYNARSRPRAGHLRARGDLITCEFPRACELAPAHARKRTMCPRPARRPDAYFLRIGREGAHGSESRAEGRVSRSRSRVLRRNVPAQRSRVSEFLRANDVSRSLPLSLSEHLLVISAVSNAELECPSEFRDSQAVARICVHVVTAPIHLLGSFESREA